MKNLILIFFVAILATTSYGQFKVTADGVNHALNSDLIVGENATTNPAKVAVGLARLGTGNAQFDFYTQSGSAVGDFQLRLISTTSGVTAFRHTGAGKMEFRVDQNQPINFKTSNITRMTVQGNGQVDINGMATVNGGVAVTSDLKTKKNVESFSLGLDEILKLNPISYQYNGFANTTVTDRTYVGLAAQELQKVAPEFVSKHIVNTYDDNDVLVSSDEILKVHDTELKYLLVNAIKQQQEMIELQSERISQLEDAINTIGDTEALNKTSVTLTSYDLAELSQNTPNPFNGFTTIGYIVPTSANSAQINIYGTSGQMLKTLNIDHVGQGTLEVNAADLPAGTYSYQLVVDGIRVGTEKMVLAR